MVIVLRSCRSTVDGSVSSEHDVCTSHATQLNEKKKIKDEIEWMCPADDQRIFVGVRAPLITHAVLQQHTTWLCMPGTSNMSPLMGFK